MRIEKCVSGCTCTHTCRIGMGTDLVEISSVEIKRKKKKGGRDVLPSCSIFLQGFNANT